VASKAAFSPRCTEAGLRGAFKAVQEARGPPGLTQGEVNLPPEDSAGWDFCLQSPPVCAHSRCERRETLLSTFPILKSNTPLLLWKGGKTVLSLFGPGVHARFFTSPDMSPVKPP